MRVDDLKPLDLPFAIGIGVLIAMIAVLGGVVSAQSSPGVAADMSDAVLVESLTGFENSYANVNGTQLHFVAGGKGQPQP